MYVFASPPAKVAALQERFSNSAEPLTGKVRPSPVKTQQVILVAPQVGGRAGVESSAAGPKRFAAGRATSCSGTCLIPGVTNVPSFWCGVSAPYTVVGPGRATGPASRIVCRRLPVSGEGPRQRDG